MKILFVAPRYHTNQSYLIKSFIQNNHQILFLTQTKGIIEDYRFIQPVELKESNFFMILYKFIQRTKAIDNIEKFRIRYFVPQLKDLFIHIRNFKPDLVIIRNRNITGLLTTLLCKSLNIKQVILYNQTELLHEKSNKQSFLKKSIQKFLFPRVRITPVLVADFNNLSKLETEDSNSHHDYFVPFITEPDHHLNREYLINDKVNILDVGKYRNYKNHYVLIDAIDLIQNKSNICVTIIGQASNNEEIKYYNDLNTYIKSKGLDQLVKLEKHVSFEKMKDIYQKNDVFVLTSKQELASISVLEAMANGLAVISTNLNGTASYIKENCGYIFESGNKYSLAKIIENIIENPDQIPLFGRNSVKNICENYSFDSYLNHLNIALLKEFDLKL